jgi:hypothetical protein
MLYVPNITDEERAASEIVEAFHERVDAAQREFMDAVQEAERRKDDADRVLQRAYVDAQMRKMESLRDLYKKDEGSVGGQG